LEIIMKRILLIAAALAAVGGVSAAYADGEWLRAGPVWLKGVIYAGSSKVALTNSTGNLVTTTANLSGALSVTGATTLRDSATLADEVLFSDVSAAQTASVGSVQGSGALTVTAIQATTVGTAGDNFTLPTGVAGMLEFVCNGAAANAMDLFPASGAKINSAATDAAISLAAGECAFCLAFSATNWGCVIGSAT
jgi:hypothetical protein